MTPGSDEASKPSSGAVRPDVKPRPILFAVLCVVFVLWIALLLFIYFKTVYPLRHGSPPAPPPSTMGMIHAGSKLTLCSL